MLKNSRKKRKMSVNWSQILLDLEETPTGYVDRCSKLGVVPNPKLIDERFLDHESGRTLDSSGSLEAWKFNNKLWRYENPCRITTYDSGKVEKLYNDGDNYFTESFLNNVLVEKTFLDYKLLRHKVDGPARLKYYPTGELRYLGWFVNGYPPQNTEEAVVTYYKEDKTVYQKIWIEFGKQISITYRKNGTVSMKDVKLYPDWIDRDSITPHRIVYDEEGNKKAEIWLDTESKPIFVKRY